MTDPLTLSQQCETAGPEETDELLVRAYEFLRPDLYSDQPFDVNVFDRLLDINTQEAFLGAVMMLKPDGARIEVIEMEDGRGAARLLWPGEGRLPKLEPLFPSLTLAALAAILRAEAAKQEKVDG